MTIGYENIDAGTMTHRGRRLTHETRCEGCGEPLTGRSVTVFTDRSGSEQGSLHDDPECLAMARSVYVPGGGPCPICEQSDMDDSGEWHLSWCYGEREV